MSSVGIRLQIPANYSRQTGPKFEVVLSRRCIAATQERKEIISRGKISQIHGNTHPVLQVQIYR